MQRTLTTTLTASASYCGRSTIRIVPDVAKDFGFTVVSVKETKGGTARTIAVCANVTIAIAAWECACRIFPKDRWLLTWGGMDLECSLYIQKKGADGQELF
jgi:hypothetical protein